MSSKFTFKKETIVPANDPRSPFYVNLPNEAKPIDNLINFFKYWKYFIKSLIHYLTQISQVKEFEANVSFQLLNSIQFPGFKDLPMKVLEDINNVHHSPSNSQATTPTKEHNRTLSSTPTLSSVTSNASSISSNPQAPNDIKRPGLFKTKSNNSTFLKNIGPQHKKNQSLGGASSKHPPPVQGHNSLHHNDVKIPQNFFPDDSLFKNLPPLLLNHHQTAYQHNTKTYKDLTLKLIPRLETLSKNLSSKIKEIKMSLRNDSFSNIEVLKDISETGQALSAYMSSIERYSSNVPVLKKKLLTEEEKQEDDDEGVMDDPFLIKIQVDYQIKHQLIQENYMFASYVNLQNISKDLFTYVLKELNVIIDKFGKLQLNHEFFTFVKEKISSSSSSDWEYFISNNPNFVNFYKDTPIQRKRETRTFKTITLPYVDSIHNKCIRFGTIYKKSRVFKNYTRLYYVLSCNYLHEFRMESEENSNNNSESKFSKSNSTTPPKKKQASSKDKIGGFIGHEDMPVKSYNLNDCTIKIKDEKGLKFQLIKKSNSSKKHTFRCLNESEFTNWFADLEQLTKFGSKHLERFQLVQSKIDENERQMKAKQSRQTSLSASTNASPIGSAQNSSDKLSKFTLNFDNKNEQGLNGIFTPTIRTPHNLSPIEGNPFDETFLSDFPIGGVVSPHNASAVSSPKLSPDHQNGELESPRLADGSSSEDTHQQQHESYLKMQQEILKQQQELLNLKISEIGQDRQQGGEKSNSSNPKLSGELFKLENGSKDTNILSLSRPTSSDSISSFVVTPIQNNQEGVQSILNANKDILTKKTSEPVFFELNDEKVEENKQSKSKSTSPENNESHQQYYQSGVPKVVVSNN